MRPSPFLPRLALCILAASTGGCAYFAPKPTLMPETSADARVDEDLPTPEGFELVRDATWRHVRTDYRRLRLTYRREDYLSTERVVEFFRTQWPRSGWQVKFVYGLETKRLILHKGSEEARIDISEDFGDAKTEFVIEVEPRTTPDGALVAADPATTIPTTPPAAVPAAETVEPARETTDPTTESGSSK
jgi:hypothetical protein